MSDQQLESLIIESIVRKLGIESERNKSISYDVPLFAAYDTEGIGLQLDSIDILEVVIAIKQDFDVKVGDEDLKALASVSSIAEHIRKCRGIENR